MRALVVYCHPRSESFTAAVLSVVLKKLEKAGADIRVLDLYADGFQPVLSRHELETYLECPANQAPVQDDVDSVLWCDTLIFVYPTWWYGLPAMLKGWLDRVLLPDVAFEMPKAEGETIRSGLGHITRLGVFTTCGASWGLTQLVGAPGKRTLLRGVRFLCARRCKTTFAAHYLMDTSTQSSREKHLAKVAARMDRFVGPTSGGRPSRREALA